MSESSEHRDIVILMARELQEQCPDVLMETDLQMRPGDPVPPIIGKHRPDIYAYRKDASFYLVGEVKIARDLENKHTYSQLTSFTQHLESKLSGCFVLGIPGEKADRAKTILRFLRQGLNLSKVDLKIFDGCDYWILDKKEGIKWHLS